MWSLQDGVTKTKNTEEINIHTLKIHMRSLEEKKKIIQMIVLEKVDERYLDSSGTSRRSNQALATATARQFSVSSKLPSATNLMHPKHAELYLQLSNRSNAYYGLGDALSAYREGILEDCGSSQNRPYCRGRH